MSGSGSKSPPSFHQIVDVVQAWWPDGPAANAAFLLCFFISLGEEPDALAPNWPCGLTPLTYSFRALGVVRARRPTRKALVSAFLTLLCLVLATRREEQVNSTPRSSAATACLIFTLIAFPMVKATFAMLQGQLPTTVVFSETMMPFF